MSYFTPLYSLLYTTLFTRQVVYAAGDDLALMGVATGRAAASTAKKADLNVGAELQVCYYIFQSIFSLYSVLKVSLN